MVGPQREETMWSHFAARMLVNAISHPIEYAKVLIQIGYEPIPPKPTTTFFGNPALGLPNIFQYVRYIKRVDGFVGCYRGLAPKFYANAVSVIAFEKMSEYIVFTDEPDKEINEEDLSEEDRKKRCIYGTLRDVIGRVIGTIVSHPLDVIALRAMAQFVGRETKYNGLFRSIIEVYRENGISGFYSGIVPRLIANVATIVMVSGSTYAIKKYLIPDREFNGHVATVMTFVCTTIMYPFHVVSHCMSVNNCGLVAGLPPQMPIYGNWLCCWSHLASINQLKRGNSILMRYYTGPTSNVQNWRPITISKSKIERLD